MKSLLLYSSFIYSFFILLIATSLSADNLKVYNYDPALFPQPTYDTHGYIWENNTIGLSKNVPKPWKDLKKHRKDIEIWGRSYSINQAQSLVDQISTQGVELLTSPIKLHGKINGKSITRSKIESKVIIDRKDTFKRKTTINSSKYSINIIKSIEFDGFARFDLQIIPREPIEISELRVELPLHADIAKYFSHYLPYDYVKQRSNRKRIFESSGLLDKELNIQFTPAIWIGNKNIGIEFVNETNVNDFPINSKEKPAITIHTKGHTIYFNRRFISKKITLKTPVTYSFAMIATPTKPKMKNWRNVYFSRTLPAKTAIKIPKKNECRDILYFGNFTKTPLKFPGLPFPPNKKNHNDYSSYQSDRALLRENRIKYIPYSALYIMPSPLDELKDYRGIWSTVPPRRGALYWTQKLGVKKPIQPVIYEHRSIRDYLVYSFTQVIKEHAIDGVYFDAATISELKDITKHRFGENLKARYYPMYAHRETVKRFWTATKSEKADFLIIHHATAPSHFSTTFADIVATGEELNKYFRTGENKTIAIKSKGKKTVRLKNQMQYKPDYHSVPASMYMTFLNQGDGYVSMLLPQVKKFNNEYLKQNDDIYKKWTRNIIATSFKYDIPLWRTRIKQAIINEIDHQIITASCLDNKPQNPLVLAIQPHKYKNIIELSTYGTNSGKIIMSIYNNSLKKRHFTVKLPDKYKITYNSMNTPVTKKTSTYILGGNGTIIHMKMAENDLLMLTLESDKHLTE